MRWFGHLIRNELQVFRWILQGMIPRTSYKQGQQKNRCQKNNCGIESKFKKVEVRMRQFGHLIRNELQVFRWILQGMIPRTSYKQGQQKNRCQKNNCSRKYIQESRSKNQDGLDI